MYLKVAKRVDLKSSHHKKVIVTICGGGVLTRPILVIILWFIQISNHYVVHLRLIQCYMSILFQ